MVTLTFTLAAIISVLAGIIILAWPKALNVVVGLWLLINGILQIFMGL